MGKLTEASVLEVNGRCEVRCPPYAIALAKRRVRHVQELLRQGPVMSCHRRSKKSQVSKSVVSTPCCSFEVYRWGRTIKTSDLEAYNQETVTTPTRRVERTR